ncbi:SDR family NAD(P)-dependent oxidoreductase [Rhodopseudomonas palustris]|uniref:SDR family NAD(P)-dependent oxidoreductase n=1 Tax=Rhodopseudomonas palustris TaxID=1076 RepID=A0AAX3DV51_RHOPL|nr:SDR family NAD(P)-dependent oxidoreductase [Rhodopseudomonas palustris]UYO38491.1 SDR family NAD(P)-dependent oxidoreductase [Rhodopseudomonas palustris]
MSAAHKEPVAVVTGASSGIGRSIALELGKSGHILHLIGRNSARLIEVRDVAPAGSQVHVVDFDDIHRLGSFLQSFPQSLGGLDILIHSAGVCAAGSFEDLSVDELDHHWRVNLRAPYVITKALLQALRSKQGQIVYVNSSTAFLRGIGSANTGYTITKQALRVFADAVRTEVNADGVRVATVYPGKTATGMQEAIHRSSGKAYRPDLLMSPDDVAVVVMHALSLPRSAELTDIVMRPMRKS